MNELDDSVWASIPTQESPPAIETVTRFSCGVSVQLVKTGSPSEMTGSKDGAGKPRC